MANVFNILFLIAFMPKFSIIDIFTIHSQRMATKIGVTVCHNRGNFVYGSYPNPK